MKDDNRPAINAVIIPSDEKPLVWKKRNWSVIEGEQKKKRSIISKFRLKL